MFTGIIRHVGRVVATSPSSGGRRLAIDLGPLAQRTGFGDSVAVCGVCLTASALRGPIGEFDVIHETLQRTGLGRLDVASRVNLEPSLRLSDGLEGHMVQGHVDGLAELARVERGGQWKLHFQAHHDLTAQMVPKGSIAIDGVSLTLVDVADDAFSVALIPTTLEETTLGELRPGQSVNIEVDLIGKYVRRFLEAMTRPAGSQTLTMEKLREAGFL